ncbi:proline-rich receptor-like protein kinase PERK9 [Canna indica]|uniref:Proline-rich receptor-like protein kinase PERK9 n=1 Tax=Canna indica TaxID=4628 RepID=A0AAQ3K2F5_9LILI|nr:proline-rich receptor-like protein kinase PERK9 [Canna indica]
MADARAREAPPPPVIGKAGRYTVFITPPRAPKPSAPCSPDSASPKLGVSASARKVALLPEMSTLSPSPKPYEALSPPSASPRLEVSSSPAKMVPLPEKNTPSPPPVQVPPLQFEKPAAKSSGFMFGFFWDAVVKVQDAHSSLDEYLADWFGLNQSKYQWALNDYYENTGKEEGGKVDMPKEVVRKGQAI